MCPPELDVFLLVLCSVLGIFGEADSGTLDAEIEALVEEREEARRQRNFARSDEIRDELAAQGIVLEDTKDGVRGNVNHDN